jgi:predicted Zn-dependent protease
LAPNSPELMDTEALVLLSKGEPSKAEAMINRALDKAPGNSTLTYHKAMILETSGRGNEARPLLERILSTDQKVCPAGRGTTDARQADDRGEKGNELRERRSRAAC